MRSCARGRERGIGWVVAIAILGACGSTDDAPTPSTTTTGAAGSGGAIGAGGSATAGASIGGASGRSSGGAAGGSTGASGASGGAGGSSGGASGAAAGGKGGTGGSIGGTAGAATGASGTGGAGGAATCDAGPYPPATWPPACYRPFSDTSPFNTKLPGTPKLVANSDAIIARVLGQTSPIAPGATQPANIVAYDTHTSGWPTYWANDGDPVFTIQCNEFGGMCSDAASGVSLHVPAGAIIQGGCGADPGWDRHLTVVDQPSGWEYDLWHVDTCPIPASGGTIQIGWGGRARIDGDGMDTDGGQGMASYTANLAGRVRVEELAAGKIDHALNIVIDCDDGTNVYPAKAHDKTCADTTDAPPMGSRLWLDMTAAEIDALPAPAWKKTLLHAMSEYGMFFGDTGSTFFFDIQTESGVQYTSMGKDDPWIAYAETAGWTYYEDPSLGSSDPYKGWVGTLHADDDGIDWTNMVWSRLRVVDPCVSQGTCP